jgi:2-iminobutanoate/2-iminopropanoate deaminase
MDKQIIQTAQAPAAIGPYSQAVVAGGLMFLSGQIPLTPSGDLLQGTISEQAEQVLKNLSAVLQAAGLTTEHVVKVTIFLLDMNDFTAVNEVYSRYFTAHHPARATVAVAGLPRGVAVEMDAIAVVPSSPPTHL